MSKKTFSPPPPFPLPLDFLPASLFCAPNFFFDLSSPYHHLWQFRYRILKVDNQMGQTQAITQLFFCLSMKHKGKGGNEDKPSRQPCERISFKSCPPAGFPCDTWETASCPRLCICTAHPNNSSVLQKVVLQLRVTPSMIKSTKHLIKVNTAVPMVKQTICMTFLQSTINTELSDFLGFCMFDSSLRQHTLNSNTTMQALPFPGLHESDGIPIRLCSTHTSESIAGSCNPAEDHHRQRKDSCQQSSAEQPCMRSAIL